MEEILNGPIKKKEKIGKKGSSWSMKSQLELATYNGKLDY